LSLPFVSMSCDKVLNARVRMLCGGCRRQK
jgi:hypothetical protein